VSDKNKGGKKKGVSSQFEDFSIKMICQETNNLYQPSLLEESQEICHAGWSTCVADCQCPSQKVP